MADVYTTVLFFGQMARYNKDRKQETKEKTKERTQKMTMITMIRKIRNAAIAVSILFVCGILGSLELDVISLSQAIEYITVSAAFCGFVLTLEVIFRFARALLVVYARRKRAFRRISAPKCRKTSANAPFVREYYA